MEGNNTTITQADAETNLELMGFRIAKITLYVLIFTLSCVGNSLVAIVIVGANDMRTPPNFLILNLALCDFITPALSIPFDLALEESKYIWPFGKAMCKVLWPFETACSTSSSLTLALISLERYKTLSKPFGRRVTNHQVLLFVLIIHAFSISLCIPYFLVLNYNHIESSCDEVWPGVSYRQAYTIVLFLCEYAVPLITMSMAYLLIYRSLRSNLLRLAISRDRHQGRSRKVSKAFQLSTASKDNVEHKRKEQNVRLAKMFIIVVVVFAISMYPNQVLWFWVDFGNGGDNDHFNYISVVSRLFTYANSVLNPFIYALKSKEFRSGFARIGRASIQPLRKISNETRRIARKYSRNVSSNQSSVTQCPVSVPMRSVPCCSPPVQACSVHTSDRKEKHTQEIYVDKCPGIGCKAEDMGNLIQETSLQETLLSPTLQRLLGDLRETDC